MSGPVQNVLVHLDFGGGAELRNAKFHALAAAPGSPVEGQIYWDTVAGALRYFDGANWQDFATAASVAVVAADLATEEARALAAEAGLQTAIDNVSSLLSDEVTRATAAEATLQSNIDAEAAARTAADTALQSAIDAVAADVAALDGNYATDAEVTAVETALQANIDAEAATRAAADTALDGRLTTAEGDIDTLEAGLAAELIARADADTALDTRLTAAEADIDGLAAGLATEIADRQAETAANTATFTGYITDIYGQLGSVGGALSSHDSRLGALEADPVTKSYVDAAIQGLDVIESVKVLSTSSTVEGLTVDGVTLSEGDRVLVTGTGAQDGVWLVAEGAWTRSNDVADAGTFVFVEGGTYASTGYVKTVSNGWVQFSGAGTYAASSGLSLTGTTFAVEVGEGIVIDANGAVATDRSVVPHKFAETIGDGTATSFTVTHNLNTQDCTASVRNTATNEVVLAAVSFPTADTAVVEFASAPAAGAYRVVIVG